MQQHMQPTPPQSATKPPPSSIGGSPPDGQTSIPSVGSTPLMTADLQGSPAPSSAMGSSQKPSPPSSSGATPMIPTTPIATSSSMGINSGGNGTSAAPRTAYSMAKKATKAKPKKEPTETVELDDLKIEKWYSGSVSIGLDDDKYWLSELQVYLRANFGKLLDNQNQHQNQRRFK